MSQPSDYTVALPDAAGADDLATAIRHDIRRGRLLPGTRLPGSRTLARRLGLSRSTVVRAFSALDAEGWLQGRVGSGMVVTGPGLEDQPAAGSRLDAHTIGFSLAPDPVRPLRTLPPATCSLAMEGGTPDLRALPLTELSRALRRVLRGRGRSVVQYGDPMGDPKLRRVLSTWLAETRGLPDNPERLIVLRGSQMGLYLLARTLLSPGDVVAVEDFGYAPAWGALEAAGARLVGVPVDQDGVRVDLLPDNARAVYLTPHHQYPTTALLSAPRRLALLDWARSHGVPLLEDDYDHEFHFGAKPVLPLAHLDRHGVVVSIGTLSKAFAPGLRLGWVAGPTPLIERLARYRRLVDRQGDHHTERAVAELLEDDTIPRHIRKMRRLYAQRRDALYGLTARLPLPPTETAGGLALWCRTEPDADDWARRAAQQGVFVRAGRDFTLDGRSTPHLRLGFAGLDIAELHDAMGRLERATPRNA